MMQTASVCSLEQRENKHVLDLYCFLCWGISAILLPLDDLLDRSRMLEIPMRLPRVMLFSWKNEPLD